MSEESNGGFFSQLKNQIIAGAGVVITTLGGVFMDEVKGMLGIAEEEGITDAIVIMMDADGHIGLSVASSYIDATAMLTIALKSI